MNLLRYLIAVMLIAAIPGAIVFWLLVHPFAPFWRRLGTGRAYAVLGSVLVAVMAGMVALRRPLLAWDFGTNLPLALLALPIMLLSGWLLYQLRRRLSVKALLGVPELSSGPDRGTLLTDGIYARMRHPRYTQMTLALLAYALVANYPAAYGAFVFWCAGILLVAVLEDRELKERFGEAYRTYRARVPRFIPRNTGSFRH